MFRILLIDEDEQARRTFVQILSPSYRVTAHAFPSSPVDLIRRENPDLVFLEVNLPGTSGVELIPALNNVPAPPQIIMYSSVSDAATIVRAVRAGAADYVVKPALLATLEQSIRRVVAYRISACTPASRQCASGPLDDILGRTRAIEELKELVAVFAPSEDPVLIEGESGTGKELVARTIHRMSRHGSGTFVPVNCAAIPDALFEAEMFGVERGAYTDAVQRNGVFERADGGTLFLDEIGEMSMFAQSKLLRVLEDHMVRRVGTARHQKIDIRIVAATNANLADAVSGSRFRRDLFYRLNILRIAMPSLRARKEDVPELATFFLRKRTAPGFTEQALRKLMGYDWPGNVRELHAIVKRASILAGNGRIEERHVRFY